MLERLRAAQSTWLGKAVLAVIFVLIIVGLELFRHRRSVPHAYRRTGPSKSVEPRCRPTPIVRPIRTNSQQLQQRLRRPITNAQARQLGLDQQVLTRLVTDALLDRQADQLGSRGVRPADRRRRRSGPDLRRRRRPVRSREVQRCCCENVQDRSRPSCATSGAPTAAGARRRRGRQPWRPRRRRSMRCTGLQAETRSIDMIVLQPSLVGDVPAPDEATLQTYFETHKAQFAAPEYRKLTYLAVTPAAWPSLTRSTAEDIAKAYDSAPEITVRRAGEAHRAADHLPNPGGGRGSRSAHRGRNGLCRHRGRAEGVGQGSRPRQRQQGADLRQGGRRRCLRASAQRHEPAGERHLRHRARPRHGHRPGQSETLDEVAPMLRKEIAEQPARTRDALRDIRDKIEDQRASGKPLAEAAKAVGFEVRTVEAVDCDRQGQERERSSTFPSRDQVLQAAFASDVGVDNDVVQTRSGDQIWFEVADIEPAHQRSFAEVKAGGRGRLAQARRRASGWPPRPTNSSRRSLAARRMEQVAAQAGGAEIKHVGRRAPHRDRGCRSAPSCRRSSIRRSARRGRRRRWRHASGLQGARLRRAAARSGRTRSQADGSSNIAMAVERSADSLSHARSGDGRRQGQPRGAA